MPRQIIKVQEASHLVPYMSLGVRSPFPKRGKGVPGMQGGGRVRLTPPGPLTYSALPGSTDGVTGAPAHTQPSQGTQPRWQWVDHAGVSLTSYRPSARPGPSQWSIPCTGRPRAQRSGPASSVDALALYHSHPSRCWAQFVELGFGAIQRRFLGAFHYMLACVGQRGSRSRQTGAMVYRMGRPMAGRRPWIAHGSIWDRN